MRILKFRAGAAILASLFIGTSIQAQVGDPQYADLKADVSQHYADHLGDLFTHFHQNPELSFQETKTAARMAKELRELGYDVTESVGKTGVVAVLKNGDGPTIMLRADSDGLPVKEDTGLPYQSRAKQIDPQGNEQYVMHACGHDVHITSLVGTAKAMMDRRDQWSGTLVLIVQPAEEIISGARAMLEDGLYTRFPKPDYALAFHVSAQAPIGHVQIHSGTAMSSIDMVDIIVHGVGAHGASPHKGIDPVLVASQIVVSLQSVVSRTIAPLKPGVITVGSIHGGTKHNIIGNRVEMQLTVRSDDFETRELLLNSIDRVAKGVAISMGVPEEKMPDVIRLESQLTPPTINHPDTTDFVRNVFAENFGKSAIFEKPREGMGGEDFAYLVAPEHGVKGVYFSVGGSPEDSFETAPSHHSPFFKIEPEPSVTLGTEAMVTAALELFKRG